jgi:hypothetical protein
MPGPPPSREVRDHLRAAVDAAIATIPYAGGALQILFDEVLQPNFDKRRDEWLKKLAEVLEELTGRMEGFDPASLETNEQFVSAVSQATRIAMGTHRQEKLQMLEDGLVNLVAAGGANDLLITRFLRFVDELEPEHFSVLKYLASPEAWYQERGLRRPDLIAGPAFAILQGAGLPISGDQLELVLHDLESNVLARTSALRGMVSQAGMWQPLATDLGNQLLAFIAAPRRARGPRG